MALVDSVIRRHMKQTSTGAFTTFTGTQDMPVAVELQSDESLVGWYQNPPPWSGCFVVFTSRALYIVDGARVERIAFGDVVGYESPASKVDVTGVRLLTRAGFRFVRMAGSFGPDGSRKDAFSFVMAIRGLITGTPVITPYRPQSGKTEEDS